jgi:hypothetical protein
MGNPASVDGTPGLFVSSAAAAETVPVNEKRVYEITHNGIDESGDAHTDEIWFTTDETTPDGSAGENKFILTTAAAVTVGPGVASITFKASGNDPTFNVAPVDYRPGQF